MNAAERVIARFGGQSALATLLGKRQSTVQHWAKTGRIPSQWHRRLLALALERGISLEAKDFVTSPDRTIADPGGRLGVLLPGLGAVASTFVAGVINARQKGQPPIGSISQMGSIRLGKRTSQRNPLIRDFVPLAGLDQLVFGAWDPIPDNAYEAALTSGVLDRHEHLDPIAADIVAIKPMPAVFDQQYVKRLDGTNVKRAANKR
jgi:myo-inositol-1-phosphate synthase